MRPAQTRPIRMSAGKTIPVPLYKDWPEGARDLVQSIDAHTAALDVTNAHLETIANCASETLGFFKKVLKIWIPVAIGAAGILWPAGKQIIDAMAIAAGVPQ